MAETYWDLFAGYSAIWILVAGYLVQLMRQQRALALRVSTLELHSQKLSENQEASEKHIAAVG